MYKKSLLLLCSKKRTYYLSTLSKSVRNVLKRSVWSLRNSFIFSRHAFRSCTGTIHTAVETVYGYRN